MSPASKCSGNVGDPIRDLFEIVVDRFFDIGVELAALYRGKDLQRLVNVGADMDAGGDLLGVAEALAGDRIAALALGDHVAELMTANRWLFSRGLMDVFGLGRRGGDLLFPHGRLLPVGRNKPENKVLAVWSITHA